MSGKKFDQGKPDVSLLSSIALIEMAKVLDFGRKKYDAHNWRKGLAWSRVLAAALRHLYKYNIGEKIDEETGLSHLAHAAVNLMFLLEYEKTHTELDDLYKPEKNES